MRLDPYYVIVTTDAVEPEDSLDVFLGSAVAARLGEPGLHPRDLAQALLVSTAHLPLRRRAALTYRQYRRHPGLRTWPAN